MNVYGELTSAQLENLSADPTLAAARAGRLWWRTDLRQARIDLGGTVDTIATMGLVGGIGSKNYLSTYGGNTGNGNFETGGTTGWSLAHTALSGTTPTSAAAAGTAFSSSQGGTAATALGINIVAAASQATTATWVNANNFITVLSATGISVGQVVTNPGGGTGFPTGTVFITSIVGTSVYLNKALTASQAVASNVTFTAAPLAGTYSLALGTSSQAGPTASTAGDLLISSAFTVDVEDRAKVLTIKFYYQENDGGALAMPGTSSGSFAVWIYDVTNAAWIQPAGVYNITQNSGTGYCVATFQSTSNSTQYQLALININATAASYNLWIDDFSVSPQTSPIGAAASDVIAYTPTFTGFGTATAISVFSSRVGDKLHVSGCFTAGTTTATQARISLGYASGNSNVTVGSSVSSNSQVVGVWSCTTANQSGVILAAQGNSYVTLGLNSSATAGYASINGNAITTGSSITFELFVPIQGWSSNIAMSNDTDTRVCSLVMAPTASATGTLGAAFNAVVFPSNNVIKDTHGAYNSTTGVFTAPVAGYYAVSATLDITHASIAVGNRVIAGIFYNSTQYAAASLSAGSTAVLEYCPCVSGMVYCNAGDTITIKSNTNGTTPSWTNGQTGSVFNVQRVSGPAVVAANESVNARYFASATAISGALATISWTTKDFDSHSAMASGSYTIPVSGKYQINVALAFSAASAAAGNAVDVQIQKNGSVVSELAPVYQSTQVGLPVFLSDTINCLAGDVIRVQASSGATTPALTASNSKNYFSIARVGN